MADASSTTIRLRHYTRQNSKDRIVAEGRILARDRNKVFVEMADRKPLSPRDAEARYLIKRGKGNAYDALAEEVHQQVNRLTGEIEFFLDGDVILLGRNPLGFDNR